MIKKDSLQTFESMVHSNSSQPILFVSQSSYTAKLAIELIGADFNKIEFNRYDSSESIKIDQIRDFTSLVSSSGSAIRNLIVIYGMEKATLEAQNAFLKTLEETPDGTKFVISTKSKSKLLKTVVSRCAVYSPSLLPKEELSAYIEKNLNPLSLSSDELHKINMSFNGNIDMTIGSVSSSENYSSYEECLSMAKSIISGSDEPLLGIDKYLKDRDSAKQLLTVLTSMAEHFLTNDIKNSKRWSKKSKILLDSSDMLNSNVSTKAVIDKLVLGM